MIQSSLKIFLDKKKRNNLFSISYKPHQKLLQNNKIKIVHITKY